MKKDNVVEEDITQLLLSADVEKFKHLQSKVIVSKRLTAKYGRDKDNPVKIKIGQIPYEKYSKIQVNSISDSGVLDRDRVADTLAKTVVEGMINPNLKNRELQDYFGAANAEKLAYILFQDEIPSIADEIQNLSENDDKVKN